jgi:UDP-N-acetylmuramoylalanine--D-glutamate ligase
MANLESSVADLNSWYSNWKSQKVLVLGIGKTGFSVADTLHELGSDVLVVAESGDAEILDILDVLGVKHLVTPNVSELLSAIEAFAPNLVIVSPGLAPTNKLVVESTKLPAPIWSDIDLAWALRDKFSKDTKWVCITGTNGKTTTTELVEAMLLASGIRASACGNIGIPILDAIRDPAEFEVLIVELSSFQLHYLQDIQPETSAVLNVAEDHLDWHGSMENYSAAKGKIYSNTRIACIYNNQDKITESLVEHAQVQEGARAIGFGLNLPSISQVGYVEEILVDRAFIDDRANSALEIVSLTELGNLGVLTPHLLSNIAAATAIARSIDISPKAIKDALTSFKLSPHRIELVLERDGIKWIDDSKATNAHAASASLRSFENVVWILGGLLKGVDISKLVSEFGKSVRAAIVIGKDRSEILRAFQEHAPDTEVFEVSETESATVMRTVVRHARAVALPGDTVLLAPAAASMDQFIDYVDRGQAYKEAVLESYGAREE